MTEILRRPLVIGLILVTVLLLGILFGYLISLGGSRSVYRKATRHGLSRSVKSEGVHKEWKPGDLLPLTVSLAQWSWFAGITGGTAAADEPAATLIRRVLMLRRVSPKESPLHIPQEFYLRPFRIHHHLLPPGASDVCIRLSTGDGAELPEDPLTGRPRPRECFDLPLLIPSGANTTNEMMADPVQLQVLRLGQRFGTVSLCGKDNDDLDLSRSCHSIETVHPAQLCTLMSDLSPVSCRLLGATESPLSEMNQKRNCRPSDDAATAIELTLADDSELSITALEPNTTSDDIWMYYLALLSRGGLRVPLRLAAALKGHDEYHPWPSIPVAVLDHLHIISLDLSFTHHHQERNPIHVLFAPLLRKSGHTWDTLTELKLSGIQNMFQWIQTSYGGAGGGRETGSDAKGELTFYGDLSKFQALEQIDFSNGNEDLFLLRNAFNDLPSLRVLKLSGLNIERIMAENCFRRTPALWDLNLDHNRLWMNAATNLTFELVSLMGTNEVDSDSAKSEWMTVSMQWNDFSDDHHPLGWRWTARGSSPAKRLTMVLAHNHLTRVKSYGFAWPYYGVLDLSWNRLRTVEEFAFANQERVSQILLGHNFLTSKSFERNSFKIFDYVGRSNGSNNGNTDARRSEPLSLVLSHNLIDGLQEIDWLFDRVERDLHVDLSYNPISVLVRGAFRGAHHLRSLSLTYCNLVHVSLGLVVYLPHLSSLDFSHNQLGASQSVTVIEEYDETNGTFVAFKRPAIEWGGNTPLSSAELPEVNQTTGRVRISLAHNHLTASSLPDFPRAVLRSGTALERRPIELVLSPGNQLDVLSERVFKTFLDTHPNNSLAPVDWSGEARGLKCYQCAHKWLFASKTDSGSSGGSGHPRRPSPLDTYWPRLGGSRKSPHSEVICADTSQPIRKLSGEFFTHQCN